jgi:hypothetical protein
VLIFYSMSPGRALSSGTLQLLGNARIRFVAVPVAAPFCKNQRHMRDVGNIFFGRAFLVTVVQRGDRPDARRLG